MSGSSANASWSVDLATRYHVIKTNLAPEQINRIMLEIYVKWMAFAMGQMPLNGRMIVAPTGRYARSLRIEWEDGVAVGVIADPSIAPEAAILEHGHAAVDLKQKLTWGRPYPMHRGIGPGPGGPRASMWSQLKSRTNTGFASIGPNSAPDSWIIPAMAAYSPAEVFAKMIYDRLSKGS